MRKLRNILIMAVAVLIVWAFLGLDAVSDPMPIIGLQTSPRNVPNEDGFIQRWLILEPISGGGDTQSAVQTTVKTEHFPNQLTVIPRDGDKVTVNGSELTWHAVDTNEYNVSLYYFAPAVGKRADNALFWTVVVVNCPEEMTNVRLAIGSNSASVWWVNGKEVIGIYGDRCTVIDDGISKRLTLRKGQNVIRGAIVNRSGAADFCARLIDSNGKPVKGYTVSLSETGK